MMSEIHKPLLDLVSFCLALFLDATHTVGYYCVQVSMAGIEPGMLQIMYVGDTLSLTLQTILQCAVTLG